jgi:hypothetical protein
MINHAIGQMLRPYEIEMSSRKLVIGWPTIKSYSPGLNWPDDLFKLGASVSFRKKRIYPDDYALVQAAPIFVISKKGRPIFATHEFSLY